MQDEIETVHRFIWKARKPVITINPMAAGHFNPFAGLTFVWHTIGDRDTVAVGRMTPEEVHETVEYSHGALEGRPPEIEGEAISTERTNTD